MEGAHTKEQAKKKIPKVTTFSVPFPLKKIKENITIDTNSFDKPFQKQIINQAFKFHSQGNMREAEKTYRYFVDQGFKDHRIFSNYGVILKDQGKLQEAEILYRKAIELNPTFADAHSNLGNILRDLGKLQEAELSLRKAIEINPNFAEANYNLGNILRDLDKLQEAELSYRKAIELKSDYTQAYSNLGSILSDLGKLQKAELFTSKALEINPNYAVAHCNLGSILRSIGNLKEAEISTRKAIEINPDYADAHYNLGTILIDLGKLQEAEISTRKAIEINPHFSKAYVSLSHLKYSNNSKIWQDKLFSESISKNKLQKDIVDIYFARANILHRKQNYKESAAYIKLANKIKLTLTPSNANHLLNKSRKLLIDSDKKEVNQKKYTESPECIFIVGMPRSGSTLLESILTINNKVEDLGESHNLEEAFIESRKVDQQLTLAELYWNKIKHLNKRSNKTTDKNLYNYLYAGIIAKRIPNAKIIHCYRNPLDNILSIHRAHFAKGNEYSSSLVDSAKVYLDQEKIMTKYKNRFQSKIYDLNYDLLVKNPNQEIKSLISWLDWEWDDSYLSPHLNPRSVSTASSVQVRSPINSKSIYGWMNYKDMLQPAIEILTQTVKYQDIAS
ncbi:tetratricopeptide repeat protein [Prochlorococcus marinus]|uniref:tetratricopeptide repeat protein n=1 Tax=Prochlorococcus marinus TaxID=1219 RepID=UPI0022B36170|nr:tetratricopeptide repeat protein [Prochlorococcus marinus]